MRRAIGFLLLALACTSPAPPKPTSTPTPERFDWRDAVVYFALVDRLRNGDPANDGDADPTKKGHFHGGDLAGVTMELDRIAALGANVLLINPVVDNIDHPMTGGDFDHYGFHGYWADDFSKIDPHFGREADLVKLVDEAHRRGIRVLMDVVYNHAGYGSKYLSDPKTAGWFRTGDTCGDDDTTKCLFGLPDFRTDDPDVRQHLFEQHLGRAERTNVDGFRLDAFKHVEREFWIAHREEVERRLGDRLLLGEIWGAGEEALNPWFESNLLDAGFDFSFRGIVFDWIEGRARGLALDHHLSKRHGAKGLLFHFISSHDVPTARFELGDDRERLSLAIVLQMTTVGVPVVYFGDEVGRTGGKWPDNREYFPGSETWDAEILALHERLIALRKKHPSLTRGTHRAVHVDGDLYAFVRELEEPRDSVLIALNRGDRTASLALPSGESISIEPRRSRIVSLP